MTFFKDETPCNYFPDITSSKLLAIGWLDNSQKYEMGTIDKGLYSKLEKFSINTANVLKLPVSVGLHVCNLCQFNGPQGGKNHIIIPGNGILYICPELIIHYISCHRYLPPNNFLKSLMNCPDVNSMDYKIKVLNNGGREMTFSSKNY